MIVIDRKFVDFIEICFGNAEFELGKKEFEMPYFLWTCSLPMARDIFYTINAVAFVVCIISALTFGAKRAARKISKSAKSIVSATSTTPNTNQIILYTQKITYNNRIWRRCWNILVNKYNIVLPWFKYILLGVYNVYIKHI